VYDRDHKCWMPNCNIGMYRIATSGRPTNTKLQIPQKRYAREDHYLKTQRPEPIEVCEDVCYVRNQYLQHYSVKNLPAQEFVSCPLDEWHLNHEGSLPPEMGIQVICCNSCGPVILALDYMLVVAIDMAAKSGVQIIKTTVQNFVDHSVKALRGSPSSSLVNKSLFVHIFGDHGLGGGTFDTVKDSKPRSPPLASKHIPTALPKGPTQIDTPVYGMFFKEVDPGTFDLTALMSPRTNSSVGRAPVNVLRDPQMNHHKRMETLLGESGYQGLDRICRRAVHQLQEVEGLGNAFLDSTKAAMAGRIIHTNNIRGRRTFVGAEETPSPSRPAARGAVQGTTSFILSSPPEMKRKMDSKSVDVEINFGALTQTSLSQATVVAASTGAMTDRDSLVSRELPVIKQRPSTAAAFVPVHHPRVRKQSVVKETARESVRRKTIYFVDEDDGPSGKLTPTRPPKDNNGKFVQPSRTVHVVSKSAPVSRKTSLASSHC
jgi:hypothetical protein